MSDPQQWSESGIKEQIRSAIDADDWEEASDLMSMLDAMGKT